LSVTTSASTPAGSYTLTITGISGALTHTTTVSLVVSAPADFTLSGSPESGRATRRDASIYGVTISQTGDVTVHALLSVRGLSSGAGGRCSPYRGATSRTLSVTTSASTPAGSYTLTITGISGSLTHTTTVSLVVSAPADFTLSGSP